MFRISARQAVAALAMTFVFAASCSQRADVRKLRFMENGRRYYDNHDYSRAIIEWKNAAEIANGDPEPFYWLGMGYFKAGNNPLAVDAFRRAVAVNPKHAAAQLRMAELLTLSNDPDLLQDAVKRLQIVLDTAPSAAALNAIALTELKLGNEDGSESYLEDALNRFPQSLSSYVILAKMMIFKKDLAGAEDVLKRAIAAVPNSADARIALGNFYLASNRSQEAEKLLREALDLDKKSGFPLFNLAMLEYRTGRKTEAEVHFRQLAKFSDPTLKPLHAIYLFKEGDKAGAIAELERIVRENPKNHDLRSRLFAAYWADNRLDLVEKLLDKAVKDNPKDMDALLQRGELYIAVGRYQQAQNDLERVVELRPETAVVHYVLANLAQSRGDDTGFRQELTESLRLNPGLLKARIALAKRLSEANAPDSAIKLLDEAPAVDQNKLVLLAERNWALLGEKNYDLLAKNLKAQLAQVRAPDLLVQDGWLKMRQRDYAAASASLEEGLQKAPSDARVLVALASLYNAQNKGTEFTERIRQYAQVNKSPEVQFFAGDWMRQTGDRDGARKFLLAAKAADPGFHEADLALAALDMEEGKLDSAQTWLKDLVALRDRDASLRVQIANLEIRRNRIPEAVAQYRQILLADKNNIYALNNLAYLLTSLNQPDEALAYAQQAKELAPTLAQVDDTLGWVLYHKGIYGEAVSYLEAAAKKSSDAAIQYHLGLAYYKTGRSDRGAPILRAALRAAPDMPEAKLAKQQLQ
ncbi:MAG TPA: tetratricopeptide repeat protein [Bryobacteraceae bacterium]